MHQSLHVSRQTPETERSVELESLEPMGMNRPLERFQEIGRNVVYSPRRALTLIGTVCALGGGAYFLAESASAQSLDDVPAVTTETPPPIVDVGGSSATTEPPQPPPDGGLVTTTGVLEGGKRKPGVLIDGPEDVTIPGCKAAPSAKPKAVVLMDRRPKLNKSDDSVYYHNYGSVKRSNKEMKVTSRVYLPKKGGGWRSKASTTKALPCLTNDVHFMQGVSSKGTQRVKGQVFKVRVTAMYRGKQVKLFDKNYPLRGDGTKAKFDQPFEGNGWYSHMKDPTK